VRTYLYFDLYRSEPFDWLNHLIHLYLKQLLAKKSVTWIAGRILVQCLRLDWWAGSLVLECLQLKQMYWFALRRAESAGW
jgi:hypothetical protein